MSLRARLQRWIHRRFPALLGAVPYHGHLVYFPSGLFSSRILLGQGVFEPEVVTLLQGLVQDGTWCFDVGANLGLMSIPVLVSAPRCSVLAFEPSPNALPFLRRTMNRAGFGPRWQLVPDAASDVRGVARFHLSAPENSEFDGLRGTGRVASAGEVEVATTTIDLEWMRLDEPCVSVIKCDVEGAELSVLRGARGCLDSARPFVVMEWNPRNFASHGVGVEELLDLASDLRFDLFSVPALVRIESQRDLALHLIGTENYLLAPRPGSRDAS